MKVCLLNDSFPPAMDGVVNVVLNYGDHLVRDHGAAVAVGTPEYPDAHYEQYRALANHELNVWFGGRLGEYKYYDMDAVIAAALDTAEKL